METNLSLRNIDKNKAINDFFEERVDKLTKHLAHFKDENIHIHANIDKNPHKEEYYASMNVYVPSGTLHARSSSFDMFESMDEVVHSVIRQAEKFKAKLRKGYRDNSRNK